MTVGIAFFNFLPSTLDCSLYPLNVQFKQTKTNNCSQLYLKSLKNSLFLVCLLIQLYILYLYNY